MEVSSMVWTSCQEYQSPAQSMEVLAGVWKFCRENIVLLGGIKIMNRPFLSVKIIGGATTGDMIDYFRSHIFKMENLFFLF